MHVGANRSEFKFESSMPNLVGKREMGEKAPEGRVGVFRKDKWIVRRTNRS